MRRAALPKCSEIKMTYRYIPVVIIAVRATLRDTAPSDGGGSMKKDNPVHKRKKAKKGNVNINNGLRPNLSIVKKAGSANTQFRMPVPIEASNAEFKL